MGAVAARGPYLAGSYSLCFGVLSWVRRLYMYVNHSEGKPRISGKNTLGDSYGKRTLPYQNTIGERKPSMWAGPPLSNFHSYVVGPR